MTKSKAKANARIAGALIIVISSTGVTRVAAATFFDVTGVVATCNALACGAAGILVGDPIAGFIEVDDAVSGPNSTFTAADVLSYQLAVGDLVSSGVGSDLGNSALNTDGDGEIASGTAVFMTSVDTGFGIADIDITLDAAAQSWEAETTFFGLGVVSSGTLMFMRRSDPDPDTDGDGIADAADNCTEIANANQRDTNADGYGNRCDADLDNDLSVNVADLILFKSRFFSSDADADFDGDGFVNVNDLIIFKDRFFMPPGPSGIAP